MKNAITLILIFIITFSLGCLSNNPEDTIQISFSIMYNDTASGILNYKLSYINENNSTSEELINETFKFPASSPPSWGIQKFTEIPDRDLRLHFSLRLFNNSETIIYEEIVPGYACEQWQNFAPVENVDIYLYHWNLSTPFTAIPEKTYWNKHGQISTTSTCWLKIYHSRGS